MRAIAIISITILFFSFNRKKTAADLLIYNATIYTIDNAFSTAEAVVIKNGKVLETGKSAALKNKYDAVKEIDASGKFIYPGFIDAHAHFYGYALSLQRVNLTGTDSWKEVIEKVKSFSQEKKIGKGKWILGRGWDQNDWQVKEFPDASSLDSVFPDNPVMLTRVDGHAAIANTRALQLSGINYAEKLTGGEIVEKNGKPTGLLIDNAMSLVNKMIPGADENTIRRSLLEAQQNCFAAGLTTVDDCGLNYPVVEIIRRMQPDPLKIRLYVIMSDDPSNFAYLEKSGIIKTPCLNVRSVKVYGDGALGSRGAALLEPYSDMPGHYGTLLSNPSHFDSVAQRCKKNGWQMCTHAIGDSGNRTILNIYAKYLQPGNDSRWRIEHAQVVNENDFNLFGKYNVVPSVQPTHATSDMYWAGDRLGNMRVKNAYAYRKLLEQNKWLPLGTDFPVEDISPIKTFFAAVFRKDAKGFPAEGYQVENSLSRQQALCGMTIWAAKANFEEHEKGSLEKGKLADLVILDHDLMTASPTDVLKTKVLMTFVNGQRVY